MWKLPTHRLEKGTSDSEDDGPQREGGLWEENETYFISVWKLPTSVGEGNECQ